MATVNAGIAEAFRGGQRAGARAGMTSRVSCSGLQPIGRAWNCRMEANENLHQCVEGFCRGVIGQRTRSCESKKNFSTASIPVARREVKKG